MTIQQTLNITNGRLTPSTEVLDASLLEISADVNNTLQVKPDGLFVASGGGSNPSPLLTTLIDDDFSTVLGTISEDVVTKRFKVKTLPANPNPDAYDIPASFLMGFKTIDSVLVNWTTVQRAPNGGSCLRVLPQFLTYNYNSESATIGSQGLYIERFVRDLKIDREEAGSQSLTIYCSYFDQSTYNIFVDDVLIPGPSSPMPGVLNSELDTPLENGQVVKVTASYNIDGVYREGESVTFTVGETIEPVLTLNRPPLENYDSIISHAIVTVTGVLNGIQ